MPVRRIITAARRAFIREQAADLRRRNVDLQNVEDNVSEILRNPAFVEWREDPAGESVHHRMSVLANNLVALQQQINDAAGAIDKYIEINQATARLNVRG